MCYVDEMQRFLPFSGMAHYVHRTGKETGRKFSIKDTMFETAVALKNVNQQTDCTTCFFEMFHYMLHHKVVNLGRNLAEQLMQSKLSVNIEHLNIPWGVFEVCMEEGFKIPGTDIQMPSCLVIAKLSPTDMSALRELAKRAGEFERKMISKDLRAMGLPEIDPKNVFTGVDEWLAKMFAIKYRDPLVPANELAPMCHANIDFTNDNGKSIDELIDTMPTLKAEGLITALDQQDKYIQKHVMRAILGLLCYINTKDPDMAPYKFKDRPSFKMADPDAMILGGKFDKAPPGYHLREPHFRHLRAERFRRDEKGDVRVIWVRGAEVGKDRQLGISPAKEITLGRDEPQGTQEDEGPHQDGHSSGDPGPLDEGRRERRRDDDA